jgi:hypothetical protein
MDEKRLADIEPRANERYRYSIIPRAEVLIDDVSDLIAEVRRLQGITRGEYICRKCGIRQEGPKEKVEF